MRRESINPFATLGTPAREGGGGGIGRTISSSSPSRGSSSDSSFALDSMLDVSGGGFPETVDAMKSLLKKIIVREVSESGRNRNRNQRRDEKVSGRAYGRAQATPSAATRTAPTHAFSDCRHKDKAAPKDTTAAAV